MPIKTFCLTIDMQSSFLKCLNPSVFLGLFLASFILPTYAGSCQFQNVYIRATKECYQIEKQGKLKADEDVSSCQIGRFRRYAGPAGTPTAFMQCLNEFGWLGLPPLSKPVWLQ